MTDVVSPEHVAVFYSTESAYGNGGVTGCPPKPVWSWIGIIEEANVPYDNSLRECRGIGSVDFSALAAGMQNPELSLKFFIQRAVVDPAYDPKTFLDLVTSPPTGIALGYEATYGSSYLSLWFKGMMFDSLDVDFELEGHQKATAKFVGQDVTIDDALISSTSRESNPLNVASGYALPLTGADAEVFINAADGEDAPATNVKKVHFYIRNNWVRIPVVRSSNSNLLKYILRGKRELGGELTFYIETKAELDWLKDATLLDIRIDLQSTDNSPYFDFTDAKLDLGQLSTKVNEVPCELQIPFKAASISAG